MSGGATRIMLALAAAFAFCGCVQTPLEKACAQYKGCPAMQVPRVIGTGYKGYTSRCICIPDVPGQP